MLPMNGLNAQHGHCIECAEGHNGYGFDHEFDNSEFSELVRDVRKHVVETGHSVCISVEMEFFIEPRPTRTSRAAAPSRSDAPSSPSNITKGSTP